MLYCFKVYYLYEIKKFIFHILDREKNLEIYNDNKTHFF